MCLYYVKRPSSRTEPFPVFTRVGGLTKRLETAVNRAMREGGRVYATDGGTPWLVADYYVEPESRPDPTGRAYWAARNQAAVFL